MATEKGERVSLIFLPCLPFFPVTLLLFVSFSRRLLFRESIEGERKRRKSIGRRALFPPRTVLIR